MHISKTAFSLGDTGWTFLSSSVFLLHPSDKGGSFMKGAPGHGFVPVARRHGTRQ